MLPTISHIRITNFQPVVSKAESLSLSLSTCFHLQYKIFTIITIFHCLQLTLCYHQSVLFSQQYNFRTYSIEQGLAQSQVTSLTFDGNGMLWLGTGDAGISVFNGISFTQITTQQACPDGSMGGCIGGLNSNNISALYTDRRKNMWIGTASGLSVYNGKIFKHFTDTAGPGSVPVTCIMQDINDNIWIGTKSSGVFIYGSGDAYNAAMRHLTTTDGLLSNHILTFFEDKNGKVWIGHDGAGISLAINKGIVGFEFNNKLPSATVNVIWQDTRGAFWIGTNKGISTYYSGEFKTLTAKDGVFAERITSSYTDETGRMFIGTYDRGLLQYDPSAALRTGGRLRPGSEGGYIGRFTNLSEENGLSSDHITCISADKAGNLWVATSGGGLCKFSDDEFISYTKSDGLKSSVVMAIQEDLLGNFWIGTDGGGLVKFNPGINDLAKRFIHVTEKEGFPAKYVLVIKEDVAGVLWIGTREDGLFSYDPSAAGITKKILHYTIKDGLSSKLVRCVYTDRSGKMWVGGYGVFYSSDQKNFNEFGKDAGLSNREVYGIAEDRNGNIWFATDSGAVRYSIDDDKKVFRYFTVNDGFVHNFCLSVIKDKEGNLWFGTLGGMSFLRGAQFISYTVKEGLTSPIIYSMIFDDSETLILGTEKGFDKIIFKYDNSIQEVKHYNNLDGFFGIECNAGAIYKDKQNTIWFGTVKGITRYNPHAKHFTKTPPLIRLNNVKLFFEEVNWKHYTDTFSAWNNLPVNPDFTHDRNHLTFDFVGVDFDKPEKVRYRFFLEGFDKEWSQVTSRREVTYSNLPPGNYIFKVIAANEDGDWSKPASFQFAISFPFWQTWWFYVCSAVLLMLLIYGIILWREQTLIRQKKMLEFRVVERTEELLHQKEELENLSIVASETVQGVLIANKDGKIEWMNEGIKRMTGYDLDEIRSVFGTTIQQLSSHPHINSVLNEIEKTKKTVSYESMHLTKWGEHQWTTATVTPVFESDNRLKKIVIIYTDITRLKETEENLRKINKDTTESILYARHIQEAMLPPKRSLYHLMPDSFIFQKPKDIVSGDFYWFAEISDSKQSGPKTPERPSIGLLRRVADRYLFLAIADCTGHGVPGALMSIIGNEFLSHLIVEQNVVSPMLILEQLDLKMKQAMHSKENDQQAKDGIDIALCALELDTGELVYSGAYRPAMILRKGKIIELSPEKYSIGGYYKRKKEFKEQRFQLEKGDALYLFTDGYADQFGGPYGKKFLMKRFRELLISIQTLNMSEQKKALANTYEIWKKDNRQVDDVLVMGIRV